MELVFSARSIKNDADGYTALSKNGLQTNVEFCQGTGEPHSPIQAQILITNNQRESFSGVIHIEMPFAFKNPRFFMPAFMYGLNRGEFPQNVPHNFPRLRKNEAYPSSPYWFTRSDRLSHPMVLVYGESHVKGFDASPYIIEAEGAKTQWEPNLSGSFYQYTGFSCNLNTQTLGYTIGYENAPWLFVQSKKSFEREPLCNNCVTLSANESLKIKISLYDYAASDETAINKAVENAYFKYHQAPRSAVEYKKAAEMLSEPIFDYAWVEKDKNYSTFVFETEKGMELRKLTSTSWTNGLSVAVPIFITGLRLGNAAMKMQAQKCIENIVANSINPKSQLPFDACDNGEWTTRGWWFDGLGTAGHTAYIIGQSVYYLLKAYEYDKKINNTEHTDWLLFAQKIMQKVEKEKNSDNEYPFVFSQNSGAGLEYDALGSSWCLAAQAYLSKLTVNSASIINLQQSEQHYFDAYVKRMECYGAPLDTSKATDSEGILAYIRAVRFLHELTCDEKYLNHLRDALCYEFTFKFCYNSPVKIPPLSSIGWSSCGGSVTSVANPHIHPMSSSVAGEILYYCKHRDDAYIKQRLSDVIKWGLQTFNSQDKEFGHGKKGWMSERFCHCEGLVTEKFPDGSPASTWFALMPWAGASILDGIVTDCWDCADKSLIELYM